jgi:hypothetical protein
MAWNDIAPDGFGREFRQTVHRALRQAYDENCRRFAPEDVGDNNISFSHTVRENLRYLLQKAIHEMVERHTGLAGAIDVYWKGLVYEVLLPGNVAVHFYKAPPGVTDVRKLRFNGSKRQIEILRVNADQLALDLEAALGHDVSEKRSDGVARHIVVVHFGDPIDGLNKLIVGEPFLSDLDAPDWLWIEDLVEEAMLYERESPTTESVASEDVRDDDDFDDLRMRDDAKSEDDDATGTEGQ